jgi:hypothetical protein
MRYFIASLLAPLSDQHVRESYRQAFNADCPIKTLHLTFIPPFTLPLPEILLPILRALTLSQTRYHADRPDIFSRNRQILYLPVLPAQPLQQYYQQLLPQLRPHITFDVTGFPPDQIPDFLPHITLDYDFTHQLDLKLPALPIELAQPNLLYEQGPGIWKPYVL